MNELLAEAVWIVIGYDSKGNEASQGTAFTLDGVGIVSAQHVFEQGKKNGVRRWVLRNAAESAKEHQLAAYRANQHVDLAVLECQAPTAAALCSGTKDTQGGDQLRIVGFPNWHTIADKISVAPTKTVQTKIEGGLWHILTSGEVRGGNSGGPFLSEEGYVAGVVLWDRDGPVAPNGGLSISHIDLAGQSEACGTRDQLGGLAIADHKSPDVRGAKLRPSSLQYGADRLKQKAGAANVNSNRTLRREPLWHRLAVVARRLVTFARSYASAGSPRSHV
jgi:hypothetical protein